MENNEKLNVNEQVLSLVNKAEQAEKSDDALKFSQAACNAANAAITANAEAWDDKAELLKLRQAIGFICDAADAAYIEDANNERIHEIFNIAAQAAGLTRRLPDEHGRFEP